MTEEKRWSLKECQDYMSEWHKKPITSCEECPHHQECLDWGEGEGVEA